MLYGSVTSMQQLKTTVLSALAFPKTGNYSGDLSVEQSGGKPSYTVKILHITNDQHGEMMRGEFSGYTLIARNMKCSEVRDGKVYSISLQDSKYNSLTAFQGLFNVFQFLLETIPCEYHQSSTKCDGNQPGIRIMVSFPKEYTSEQLDSIHRFFPKATPGTFWSKLAFNIGKQNGFLYSYEIYYPNGERGYGMSFSNVTINPEWSLDDFTPPAELETIEISTEKQYAKHFPTAQSQPAPKRSRKSQSFGDFLSQHRSQIWTALIVIFRYAGILLLLAGIVIYFRRKEH